jgi:uncharacterized protein involved in exopolysaccharide biosynthesis
MEQLQCNSSTKEITIPDVACFFWRHKITISTCVLITTIAAVIYSLIVPVKFQSQTILLTKTGAAKTSDFAQIAALAGVSMFSSGSTDISEFLPEVIKDRDFMLKVLTRKWLYSGDSLFLEQIWEMKPDTSRNDCAYAFETAKVNALRNGKFIVLTKDIKTGLLSLTTTFGNAQLTYDVNAYVLQLLDSFIRDNMRSQAKDKRQFIEQRIEEVSNELLQAENFLTSFKERNAVSLAPRVRLEEERLQRKVMINQEVYIELQKQYEMARIQEKNDQAIVQVIQQPEIPVVKYWPKRSLMVMQGMLIGFVFGILLVCGLHFYKSIAKVDNY